MQNDVSNDFQAKTSQWHQQALNGEQLTRNPRSQSDFTSKPMRQILQINQENQ